MNKKAQISYYVSMLIIKIILLAIVITFVCLTIFMLVADSIGTERLRSEVFVERVLSSPDCLSYHDIDMDRYSPSVIDVGTLTPASLAFSKLRYSL